jgi:glycosyltransferase involved in cell wall biosynthesis
VLAEAMLAGIPCVATDVGDARLLGDGHVAIVPPGDSAALAGAVAELCALSSDARMRRGQSGRRHVAASYSLRAVAGLYRDLYRDLAASDASTGIGLERNTSKR